MENNLTIWKNVHEVLTTSDLTNLLINRGALQPLANNEGHHYSQHAAQYSHIQNMRQYYLTALLEIHTSYMMQMYLTELDMYPQLRLSTIFRKT